MPTSYYFTCQKCRTRGGFLGEQPWGWGSFGMIESYKYIAHHIHTCGEDSIRIISEEVDDYADLLHHEYNDFLDQTKHIFPHSLDWEFLDRWKNLSVDELKQKWVVENRIADTDERVKLAGMLEEIQSSKDEAGHPIYYGRLACEDEKTHTILFRSRELPEKGQSYMIIGEGRNHPEFGAVVDVHKMVLWS